MSERTIQKMRTALSWARTLIDDPGAAKSVPETLNMIDDAIGADIAEPEPSTRAELVGLLRESLDVLETVQDLTGETITELLDGLGASVPPTVADLLFRIQVAIEGGPCES